MADNVGYTPGEGASVAADDISGHLFQRVKLALGADGVNDGDVSAANPVPVTGSVTVGNFPAQIGLTDAQLRASAVPVSGTVTANTGLSQPLTDAQLRAAAVPVSAASLPLPTGAATSALQPDVMTTHPTFGSRGAVVRQAPADIWSVGFADSGSGLLASEFTQRRLGTGMGVTQGSSNLLVTTGTTANSEFLARSTTAFKGAFTARHKTILSQRIAQNNFAVMMADMIGEGLACTINSATSITVTKAAHGFTTINVGQFMMIGAITGANGVPNRYAIASIPSVDTINFTVAGWPASGSCTVDLFGWNYLWTQYSGTTATNASIDAQRRGWNSGLTTATINTTAAPGHVMQTYADGRNVAWSDALVASATTPTVTTRGSRVESLPDDDVNLYVYLWSYNGTSAPASTTTWTLGFIAVEDNVNVPTYIAGVRPTGNAAPLPVAVQGTVATSFTQPALVAGSALIGDVGIQYRGSATGAATLTNVNSPATPVAQQLKSGAGRLLGILVTNTSASTRWLKIFNLASASVTPGTTAATTEIGIGAGRTINWSLEGGAGFATGITIMVTGGQGLTNNTGITLGDVTGFTSHA
jgi:hypothetical protein